MGKRLKHWVGVLVILAIIYAAAVLAFELGWWVMAGHWAPCGGICTVFTRP